MSRLGLPPRYTLDDLRRKPMTAHGIHEDFFVDDENRLNLMLVGLQGLSGVQSRVLLRDMERVQRRRSADADRSKQLLEMQKRQQEQAIATQNEQSELQLLATKYHAVSGRLTSKVFIASTNAQLVQQPLTHDDRIPLRESRLIEALKQSKRDESASGSPPRRQIASLRPPAGFTQPPARAVLDVALTVVK